MIPPTSARFIIADVFTETPFGGNQLGVFPDARGIEPEVMQTFARELNYAESTFVLPPERPGSSYRVRIFTPKTEVPFAGHPNVGTAAVLAREGLLPLAQGTAPFVFDEAIGPITGTVAVDGPRLRSRLALALSVEQRPTTLSPPDVARLIGLEPADVAEVFTAAIGIPFTFVRARSPAAVDRAGLDLGLWRSGLARSWAPQVFVFASASPSGAELHARMFAPGFGIPEDPATGSASVGLAAVLAGRSGTDGDHAWTIMQGVAMGRPSRIEAGATVRGGQVVAQALGGATTIVGEGRLELPQR